MRHADLSAALIIAFVTVTGCASHTGSEQSDPRVGKWTLNVSRSNFNGPGLRSQTVTFAPAEGGALTFSAEQVNPDGKQLTIGWTAKSDGRDYPVTGHPIADMVSMTETDANTSEATLKAAGKITQRIAFAVSPDGKTMMATVTGITSFGSGDQNKNVHVLEKQ